MLKRFRLVIVLVILFIIELAIVPSLETTRLNNAQASDAGLELVRAESLGAQDGQIRLRVYFRNKGTQTASYPYLQGEAAGTSIYLSFAESLQPSGSTIIAEIPPKTEAAGIYIMDEYSSEQAAGETAVLLLDNYEGDSSECKVEL